jgi:hypothetical protein
MNGRRNEKQGMNRMYKIHTTVFVRFVFFGVRTIPLVHHVHPVAVPLTFCILCISVAFAVGFPRVVSVADLNCPHRAERHIPHAGNLDLPGRAGPPGAA